MGIPSYGLNIDDIRDLHIWAYNGQGRNEFASVTRVAAATLVSLTQYVLAFPDMGLILMIRDLHTVYRHKRDSVSGVPLFCCTGLHLGMPIYGQVMLQQVMSQQVMSQQVMSQHTEGRTYGQAVPVLIVILTATYGRNKYNKEITRVTD